MIFLSFSCACYAARAPLDPRVRLSDRISRVAVPVRRSSGHLPLQAAGGGGENAGAAAKRRFDDTLRPRFVWRKDDEDENEIERGSIGR
nr:hypothetical protein CFP56_09958 [Quercus suber]